MSDWAPLLLSFRVASVAALIALVLGVSLAGLLTMVRIPGRDLLDAVMAAPMVLPPTVLGYYVLVALGRQSLIGRAYEQAAGAPIVFTPTGAVVAASIGAFPLVMKSARAAMEEVDPSLLAAARSLGAGPFRAFFTIMLPLSRTGILAGLALGFARALGDFGVTLMVAGNIPGVTRTASLAIYDLVQSNREHEATGLVLVMTALAVLALYAVNRMARKAPHV